MPKTGRTRITLDSYHVTNGCTLTKSPWTLTKRITLDLYTILSRTVGVASLRFASCLFAELADSTRQQPHEFQVQTAEGARNPQDRADDPIRRDRLTGLVVGVHFPVAIPAHSR